MNSYFKKTSLVWFGLVWFTELVAGRHSSQWGGAVGAKPILNH